MGKKAGANNKRKKFYQKRWFKFFLIAFIALIGLSYLSSSETDNTESTDFSNVINVIKEKNSDKDIKTVEMVDNTGVVKVDFEDDSKKDLVANYPIRSSDKIIEAADKAGVEVKVERASETNLITIFTAVVPLIILALIGFMIYAQVKGTGILGGKDKEIGKVPNIRFKDIAGQNEAVEEVSEVVEFLKHPEQFSKLGAKPPKGVLLSGPPGNGKTLLAKAVAGEAGVPFFTRSGADFIEIFAGAGPRKVRKLFEEAQAVAPSIIFIDEIDSVGSKRVGGGQGADQEHNRTVTELLTQMDGFNESNVIVIAATNAPDKLDDALTRPGRFDRKISVELPDWRGRIKILKVHSKNKKVDPQLDYSVLAKSTTGLSGAELANIVNEALINAGKNRREFANLEDFMEALSITTIGRARKSHVVTDDDKKVTAAHEAGHAVVGLALDKIEDPTHITIVPRGFSGGHTKIQESENNFQQKDALEARMAMMMGGYAAEKRFFGEISQGPGHDLKNATDTAMNMVTKMGMGKYLQVFDDQTLTVSSVGEKVREEVETFIQQALTTATSIINDPIWGKVHQEIVEQLLEKETLESDEIQEIKQKIVQQNL